MNSKRARTHKVTDPNADRDHLSICSHATYFLEVPACDSAGPSSLTSHLAHFWAQVVSSAAAGAAFVMAPRQQYKGTTYF